MAHHAEVVADEEVRETRAFAQIHEQIEHLRLDRDIERDDRSRVAPPPPTPIGTALISIENRVRPGFGSVPRRPFRVVNSLKILALLRRRVRVAYSVNPQVHGSSPGRGAKHSRGH